MNAHPTYSGNEIIRRSDKTYFPGGGWVEEAVTEQAVTESAAIEPRKKDYW